MKLIERKRERRGWKKGETQNFHDASPLQIHAERKRREGGGEGERGIRRHTSKVAGADESIILVFVCVLLFVLFVCVVILSLLFKLLSIVFCVCVVVLSLLFVLLFVLFCFCGAFSSSSSKSSALVTNPSPTCALLPWRGKICNFGL